jgi:hypothetical protein
VLADGIYRLDLRVERISRGGINRRLAVKYGDSTRSRAEDDDRAKEEEGFFLAGSWHASVITAGHCETTSFLSTCKPNETRTFRSDVVMIFGISLEVLPTNVSMHHGEPLQTWQYFQ